MELPSIFIVDYTRLPYTRDGLMLASPVLPPAVSKEQLRCELDYYGVQWKPRDQVSVEKNEDATSGSATISVPNQSNPFYYLVRENGKGTSTFWSLWTGKTKAGKASWKLTCKSSLNRNRMHQHNLCRQFRVFPVRRWKPAGYVETWRQSGQFSRIPVVTVYPVWQTTTHVSKFFPRSRTPR